MKLENVIERLTMFVRYPGTIAQPEDVRTILDALAAEQLRRESAEKVVDAVNALNGHETLPWYGTCHQLAFNYRTAHPKDSKDPSNG